jgi:hypothetical protein
LKDQQQIGSNQPGKKTPQLKMTTSRFQSGTISPWVVVAKPNCGFTRRERASLYVPAPRDHGGRPFPDCMIPGACKALTSALNVRYRQGGLG